MEQFNMPSKHSSGTRPVASSKQSDEQDRLKKGHDEGSMSEQKPTHECIYEGHTLKELMLVIFVAIVGILAFYFVNLHIWFG